MQIFNLKRIAKGVLLSALALSLLGIAAELVSIHAVMAQTAPRGILVGLRDCGDGRSVGDVNNPSLPVAPSIINYEGTVSIMGEVVPLPEIGEDALVVYAVVGTAGDRCIGATAEVGRIGTVKRAGLYRLSLQTSDPLELSGRPLNFYLVDGQTLDAANTLILPRISVNDSILQTNRLNLNFPNDVVPPPVVMVPATTYFGTAISPAVPGGLLAGVGIIAELLRDDMVVYTSEMATTGDTGSFALIVDPGTDQFVGLPIRFRIVDSEVFAVQEETFSSRGGTRSGFTLSFTSFMVEPEDPPTPITARLSGVSVPEGGQIRLFLSREGRLDEAAIIRVSLRDVSMALSPDVALEQQILISPNQSVAELAITTNTDMLSPEPDASVVLTLALIEEDIEDFELNQRDFVFTVTDVAPPEPEPPDPPSPPDPPMPPTPTPETPTTNGNSGGSCNFGGTASLGGVITFALPVGFVLLGSIYYRRRERESKAR